MGTTVLRKTQSGAGRTGGADGGAAAYSATALHSAGKREENTFAGGAYFGAGPREDPVRDGMTSTYCSVARSPPGGNHL